MNLIHILQSQAQIHPTQPAIIDTYRQQRRVTTFAELEHQSAQMAALLHHSGLRPGDSVLVFLPMSAELYIVLGAIFRLGLIAMFLDPGQGRAHIEACCALHPPQAFIAGSKAHLLRLVSPALRRISRKFVVGLPVPGATSWQQAASLSPQSDVFAADDATPALLTFTSGSTGQPKAALRTHGFLLAQHRVLADSLQLSAGQIDLSTMPIVALANMASGVTSLIPKADLRYPGLIDPAPVIAQMQSERVDSTVASPALLTRLADYGLSQQIHLPGLKKIFTGGAPVFPNLLDRLRQLAPNADVVAVYGSTEAEPMAKISVDAISLDDRHAMQTGCGLLAGLPVEAIQLRILPDRWGKPIGPYTRADFAADCCAPGEFGEIVVSGDHVLTRYLHGQGDIETKFHVGNTIWHRTGDAGYLDAHGRVWLLGRCAARIDDEYGQLYPFSVECAVSSEPDIQRGAVVAHQKRRTLLIECTQPVNAARLAELKQTLHWAAIEDIRIVKNLPLDKRHNAKIDYPALQRQLID
ncbi:MAG: AMP-binding protein [Anaerolineae bacterium]|nr:AMP-binding protein [Anaerolineae bacterium]